MRLIHQTIWIARSPEVVFDFFMDFSKPWRLYVRSMHPTEPGPLRAGSRIRVTMDLGGGPHEFDLHVLACERPSLWRHRTNETDFFGYIEYRFDRDGAGTLVTFTMQAKPVTLYGWLATPLLLLRRNRSYVEQLPNLKRAVEKT
jgi:Polyketide cyclase / dehydrase and lipid transport